ncbi:MAG TPA: TIGR00730 family Rossman fold protein [Erysipelotrichaceae bacterium]|nr:TIGR00730 family Rossman fold protein [Erysipelotrichaceae bacterium]
MNICVYGASSNHIDKCYLDAAYELGKYMAEKHITLVFGGGDTGIMGQVNRGIIENKGQSIGIAPKFFEQPGILAKNCTQFIYTNTMRERKQKMEDLADAFIMAPGGIGTYEEFFEILTLKQLRQNHKPLVIMNTNNYYDSLTALLNTTIEQKFMDGQVLDLVNIMDDPRLIIERIEAEVQE